ncbi:hypothetical protein MUU74_06455 [Chryseobacterium daecheongense]|uniref:hypothetical protein n=1 Tax=Chryseobacterium daecheongense TaxID=192389 RepID=UPI001FD663B9|nr:hypothetical protein [Chryseobacterium daecheongense]UOU99597.1 hypothetical protein MUU74_06455 [Chryseobacterium daecheongense]
MKKFFLLLFMAMATIAFAQNQFKIVQGSFDFLKDQSQVNVQLKLDNTHYQVENFTEEQYLERRKKDVLANPKRGEEAWKKWSDEWTRFKDTEYLKYFTKGANKKSKIVYGNETKAKYTLIIDAKWIYAGWHGGLIGQEAKLTSNMKFVETDNPSNVVLEIEADQILGKPQNKDFVMEYGRIAGAFEATGSRLMGKEYKRALRK